MKMNAWEQEAEHSDGLLRKRTWGFLDRDDAIHARARAINEMEIMGATLQGCDWCCGGGDHLYEFYKSVVVIADKYLEEL